MSKRTWILFIIICVAFLGGLVYLSQRDRIDVSSVDASRPITPSKSNGDIGDRIYGKADSKVTLIEYGDYQCPGCGSVAPVVKDVVEKYKGQIAYIFRNMPLSQMHPNARAAAATAEAAGLQDKFWQMHDLLYQRQKDWENLSGTERSDRFVSYAQELGLSLDQFKKDVDNPRINQKLNYDTALAKKSNVTATPSFFLNGKLIDQQIKDGKIVPAGTKDANAIWSDRTTFSMLVIEPALRDAGIELPAKIAPSN